MDRNALAQLDKLRALADIGDMDPEFVLLAGSLEHAHKWQRLT